MKIHLTKVHKLSVNYLNKKHFKMLGPFATTSRLTPIHQMSLAVLSRAACASMSTTTTTTTTRDRGMGPINMSTPAVEAERHVRVVDKWVLWRTCVRARVRRWRQAQVQCPRWCYSCDVVDTDQIPETDRVCCMARSSANRCCTYNITTTLPFHTWPSIIISANVDRFSRFFHWPIPEETVRIQGRVSTQTLLCVLRTIRV